MRSGSGCACAHAGDSGLGTRVGWGCGARRTVSRTVSRRIKLTLVAKLAGEHISRCVCTHAHAQCVKINVHPDLGFVTCATQVRISC